MLSYCICPSVLLKDIVLWDIPNGAIRGLEITACLSFVHSETWHDVFTWCGVSHFQKWFLKEQLIESGYSVAITPENPHWHHYFLECRALSLSSCPCISFHSLAHLMAVLTFDLGPILKALLFAPCPLDLAEVYFNNCHGHHQTNIWGAGLDQERSLSRNLLAPGSGHAADASGETIHLTYSSILYGSARQGYWYIRANFL